MIARSILAFSVASLLATSVAWADVMVFTPDPPDLGDLDHSWIYTWGIDVPLDPGESVIAADLTFDDIRNWDDNPNFLYIHQLDWAELGVEQLHDGQAGGDYFALDFSGEHTHLVTYENLPSQPQDITYTFTADDLAVLNAYLADGRVGLGLDPDCHFYNEGIELTVETIPEPNSLALLTAGVLALLGRRW